LTASALNAAATSSFALGVRPSMAAAFYSANAPMTSFLV
jgi:hypothetical protein